ncbi:MAG: flagellar biosynthesis protein FliQ [Clostridia bacterium]|jgi:flagellar biosynthetic protein FliQ|nr:flagellar biosynthesis protein FliQ [Clostridia bacterium]MDN5322946.1 flagellar biosynthesis protein FliQ [Clostridia bacterium]
MTQDYIIYLAREAVYTVLLIAGPLLAGSILVGLLISIFQATTQIQEQTLTFVPKLIVILTMVVILGPWMLNILVGFTKTLFETIPKLGM